MSFLHNNALIGASGAGGAAGYQIDRSLRFNSGDSATLSRTFSSSGDRRTWTLSWWMKLGNLGVNRGLFGMPGTSSSSPQFYSRIGSDDKLYVYEYNTGGTYQFLKKSAAVLRDPSAWYHCVFQFDSTQSTAEDGFKIYLNGTRLTDWDTNTLTNYAQNYDGAWNSNANTGVHVIGRSDAYFDGYMAEVNFVDGQALTASDFGEYDSNNVWQPKDTSELTFGTNGFRLKFSDNTSTATIAEDSSGNNNDWTANNIVGFSAVYALSTTAASSGTVTNGTSNPYWIDFDPVDADLDYDGTAGGMTRVHDGNTSSTEVYWTGNLGSSGNVKRARFDLRDFPTITSLRVYGGFQSGYVNYQYRLLDSNKTEISGTSGTFGTVGWHSLTISGSPRYLEMSCLHSSSSSTRHRLYGIEVNGTVLTNGNPEDIDSLIDTPTNYEASSGNNGGNYCTLNPLDKATNAILSNGNLQQSYTSGTGAIRGTFAYPKTGKWYYEVTPLASQYNSGYFHVGIATANANLNTNPGYDTTNEFTYWQNGSKTNNVSYGASFTAGDVIGVAFDADAGTLTFYKNGVSQGVNSTGLTGEYFPYAPTWNYNAAYNFGQRAFAYPVSNYLPLSTTNLPTPTIADGSAQFDAKLYTGNGTSQTITGYGFSPDWVWFKSRNGTDWHALVDTVRGKTKVVFSNSSNVEETRTEGVSSFNSDGFSLGDYAPMNKNNDSLVAWAWNAGANSSKTFTVKVVSDSGNKYRFDDFGTSAVTLDLEEGSTYVFDQSDSSNSGHPLRFSTTSDGTHNSGTEYTTGVTTTGTPGSAGAKTTIVVASGAPTLYYYCSAHSGMGGQANTNSTAGASNFAGSIQSTVRANPSAGFSIVSYTGSGTDNDSVGHGLNAVPSMWILKSRTGVKNWYVYTNLIDGSVDFLVLNSTAGKTDSLATAPTSSVFHVKGGTVNTSGHSLIGYVFTPVEGYSAFGSYTGNGLASGPFAFTGFRPRVLLYKRTDAADTVGWILVDSARNTYNVIDDYLSPTTSAAEGTTNIVDFLSNGFKMRIAGADGNVSGGTYVYAAFAEHPFKTARAR